MARVTTSVNASKAFRKMVNLRKKLVLSGRATTKQLVELGKLNAQQYVPKDTFETYDSIRGIVEPQQDGSSKGAVEIQLKARTRNPKDANRGLTTHDVAKMMAANKWGARKSGFTSGNPQFMNNAKKYLNRIKKQIGMKNIKGGQSKVRFEV